MPTFHVEPAEPAGGSEQERSTYVCNKRQQILRLVSQWVALYGPMLHTDPVATSFLQVPGSEAGLARLPRVGAATAILGNLDSLQKLSDLVSRDARLSNLLREQWPERRRHHRCPLT